MSFFHQHVFICCNQRTADEACCNRHGSSTLLSYMKSRIKAVGMAGEGQIRVNKAGCLGRCQQGPVMVIYPQQTWYTFIDQHDIDEIIEQHLLNNQVVERLQI